MTDDHPNLVAARDLTDALNGLNKRLDTAEEKEQRLVTVARVLVAVAFTLALAVGALAYLLARENSSRITADCQTTNQGRAEAISVLDQVLPAVIPHATPAGEQKLDGLQAAVAAKFAPIACS